MENIESISLSQIFDSVQHVQYKSQYIRVLTFQCLVYEDGVINSYIKINFIRRY